MLPLCKNLSKIKMVVVIRFVLVQIIMLSQKISKLFHFLSFSFKFTVQGKKIPYSFVTIV
jgi:hypothetical protein